MSSPESPASPTPGRRHPPADAWRARSATIQRMVQVDARRVLLRALGLGLVFSLLLALLFYAYYRAEYRNGVALLAAGKVRVLHLASQALGQEMASIMSDLRYLSRHNELTDFLEVGTPAVTRRLAEEYAAFIRQKRNYDQLRFIDPHGRERIRVVNVDDGVRISPEAELRDMEDRYYLPELRKLREGEIYVSPMDLDTAREQPTKPVIRMGMLVTDRQGRPRGWVVISYRARILLEMIRNTAGAGNDIWLLNDAGYWLMGPDPADEWAFMYPDRLDHRFSLRQPEAWREMQRHEVGVHQTEGVDLMYLRVYPLVSPAAGADTRTIARPVSAERYHWLLVAVISPQSMAGANAQLIRRLLVIYGALALFAFAVAAALSRAAMRGRALSGALEKVLDSVPMLISYVDAEERYRFNNMAYFHAHGIPPDEIYGRTVREVLGEAAYQAVLPHIRRVLSGHRVDFEMRIDYAAVGPRDMVVAYVPDVAGNGEVRGFYAVVNDVTQIKDSERRDRQRLLELAHVSRLASVGEVTTEIAHQINQPLTAIAMYSAAALRTLGQAAEHSQVADWLEAINAQSRRASEVVRRLRRFVRKGEVQRQTVDLNELVGEVVALMDMEAKSRQVEIGTRLAQWLPPVLADRLLIEQVIYNLTRNGMEAVAGQAGARRVDIRTYAEGPWACVDVADTGPGVEADLGERIFESFTTLKADGLGVGLALSRSIVASHEGEIRYHNRPEGGAVFTFRLPAKAA